MQRGFVQARWFAPGIRLTPGHASDSARVMNQGALAGLLKRALLPTLCLAVGGYFLAHAVSGPSGILALQAIRAERAQLEAVQARLEAERDALGRRIALLDPRGADPDYADELVRRNLGVMRPDEIVIPLPPPEDPSGPGG